MSQEASVLSFDGRRKSRNPGDAKSQRIIRDNAANEFVFAVVGHVGSGTSYVCELLKEALERRDLKGGAFEATILKARDQIRAWAETQGKEVPDEGDKRLSAVERLQALGDEMRLTDHAAVARALVVGIRNKRAELSGQEPDDDGRVEPDGVRRAYIIDAVRHPAEVSLLRHVYQSAFVLIGVVSDPKVRLERIRNKYPDDASNARAKTFMERDAKEPEKHGQRVNDAFHLADFFVDNSQERVTEEGEHNPLYKVSEELFRLIKIVTHTEIVRPRAAEKAMYHAYAAQMTSACLSRQVGAALVDRHGNLLATGTNEVPRAGGGVYGEGFDQPSQDESIESSRSVYDDRCAFKGQDECGRHCANTRTQTEIIDEVIETLSASGESVSLTNLDADALKAALRNTSIGSLIEFSRAVHAEMDALISAARSGASPAGGKLFVTTFPCHYCARHIIASGVDEVQYIEPYPKSKAFDLHRDAIAGTADQWVPPSRGGNRVLFRPFQGVAPRLYRRAFLKDRELKDKMTGSLRIQDPEWTDPWHLGRESYTYLEAALEKRTIDTDDGGKAS